MHHVEPVYVLNRIKIDSIKDYVLKSSFSLIEILSMFEIKHAIGKQMVKYWRSNILHLEYLKGFLMLYLWLSFVNA